MLQELESIASTLIRGIDDIDDIFSLEERASQIIALIELLQEICKAMYSLALKFHIPMSKAYAELNTVLFCTIFSEKDTNDAVHVELVNSDDENEKEEFKILSGLLERCALYAANIDLERIYTMQIRENDIPIIVKEIMIKIMEKYKMPNNRNARVQDFVKDIFENTSMEDCIVSILQNASMQDFFQNIFEKASVVDVVMDIFVITMDVLSIFNQRKETSEVQQIAE